MKKILVIDDDEAITDIIRRCLSGRYEIVTENSGAKALELIKASEFDLIIADIIMPEVDGIGILAYMKKARMTTPVLIMSGHPVGEQFFDAAILLGAVKAVEKPFTMKALMQAVEKILGQ